MRFLIDHPIVFCLVTFLVLWLCAWLGATALRGRVRPPSEFKADFAVIVAATLTLLGLVIGFSFAMATSRYDHRKQSEATEANAIGTEFLRADLLPPADAERVRALLKDYLA